MLLPYPCKGVHSGLRNYIFLNQAIAWFLRIASVCECLYACVCPPPRLLITSGVICTPYDWLNKFYGFYMAAMVGIGSGRDVSKYTRRGN